MCWIASVAVHSNNSFVAGPLEGLPATVTGIIFISPRSICQSQALAHTRPASQVDTEPARICVLQPRPQARKLSFGVGGMQNKGQRYFAGNTGNAVSFLASAAKTEPKKIE